MNESEVVMKKMVFVYDGQMRIRQILTRKYRHIKIINMNQKYMYGINLSQLIFITHEHEKNAAIIESLKFFECSFEENSDIEMRSFTNLLELHLIRCRMKLNEKIPMSRMNFSKTLKILSFEENIKNHGENTTLQSLEEFLERHENLQEISIKIHAVHMKLIVCFLKLS